MGDIHILQIEIRSKKLSFILEFLKNISFIKKVKVIESTESQEDFVVPQWQQDLVMNRIKNAKPENYTSIDDLDNEIKLQK